MIQLTASHTNPRILSRIITFVCYVISWEFIWLSNLVSNRLPNPRTEYTTQDWGLCIELSYGITEQFQRTVAIPDLTPIVNYFVLRILAR